jgi:hypothetical protein
MRRLLVLGGAVLVVAVAAVVGFAAQGPMSKPTTGPSPEHSVRPPESGPFALAARGPGFDPQDDARRPAMSVSEADGALARTPGGAAIIDREARRARHRAISDRLIADLAMRLDIQRDHLRGALLAVRANALARAVDRGVIGAEQRLELEACMEDRGCDRRTARSAIRALKRDITPTSWDELQEELLVDLARHVGQRVRKVRAAVRDELEAQLTVAQTFGVMSDHGRHLVLTCFDVPNHCNIAGLRREVRLGRDGR